MKDLRGLLLRKTFSIMDLTSVSLLPLVVVARLLVVYLCLEEAGRLAIEDLGLT